MAFYIGVDVGGTFTDAFAANEQGQLAATKTPSTPPDFSQGVLQVIRDLAEQLDLPVDSFLADTATICHGTTATLNALVSGDVAKIGFITTKGHQDSISIMNLEGRYKGLGPDAIQDILATRKPPPLLPKRRIKEVTERIDYKGAIVVALNEEEVRRAVEDLLAEQVEGIAISLLWSFRNPLHEQRIRSIVQEMAPHLYIGLSSDISPRIREYARSATTVMSTQVGPTLRNYLQPLEASLHEMGSRAPLLIMQGSGGAISAREAPKYAITTIGSVLTGGIVGAQQLSARLGHRNIITTDVGGTTFLVGLIVDGRPVFDNMTTLNQFTLNVPMMRVRSIGSGGGALAWLDQGRNLRVGPRSAGAKPGPACYGQGGTDPTVTDANLVLGILDPDYFLGGRKPLVVELARQALKQKIADPLHLSVEEAAAAIFAVQNAQTADVLRNVVIGSGYDPRDFVMYAFGGAGPVHCAAYGAELGVREIVVPLGQVAATFSAYGLAVSDIILSAEVSDPVNAPIPAERLNQNFARLEELLQQRLLDQGTQVSNISLRRELDIRYTMQIAEVPVPVKHGVLNDEDVESLFVDFEAIYASLFGRGTGFRDAGFQVITYRVYATGHLPVKPALPEMRSQNSTTVEVAVKGQRPVWLDPQRGWQSTIIYDYQRLAAGHILKGPAIVEAPTTTVVLPAGTSGRVDHLGNIVMRYDDKGATLWQ
jgi:N-methylhydantoinase A